LVELKRRTPAEVKALGREGTVELMRQAGVVGAGGGGFPTYFKYKDSQPCLIVNATESEPGYWADKVIHRQYLDEFLLTYEALKFIFGFETVSMCVHEKDREWYAPYAMHSGGVYDLRVVPNEYSLGEEKTLIKHATDTSVPRRVETPDGGSRPGMPLDVGILINNSETLLNIHNALFLGKPVTTKFLQVYGEGTDLKVYEAPLGASITEVLGMAGISARSPKSLSVIDGGPYLHEMCVEELGDGDAYIRRTTNALLAIPRGTPAKEYAGIRTRPPEEGAVSLVGRVSGVDLLLGGRFLTPAASLVSEGDYVKYGQKIGEPADEGLSIGVWASMCGTISSVEEGIVAIVGGALPQEEAEAESWVEASR